MLLPRKALSVFTESEGRSGGRRGNYGNSGQGVDPRNRASPVSLWQFPAFLLAARVLYPRQVPLNTVTSVGVGEESSLTHNKEGRSMSLESDTSDLKLGVSHFLAVLPLCWLLYFTCQVCFLFCKWG